MAEFVVQSLIQVKFDEEYLFHYSPQRPATCVAMTRAVAAQL